MVSTVRYDVVVHTIYCFDLELYLTLGVVQSMGQQDKDVLVVLLRLLQNLG